MPNYANDQTIQDLNAVSSLATTDIMIVCQGSSEARKATLTQLMTLVNANAAIDIAQGGTGQATAPLAFDALSPMSALGDTIYGGTAGAGTRLAGNTLATKKFLRQTGTGAVSAAPAWDTVTSTDVGLSAVENTALSTWAGSANITTLGTIVTGIWHGTAVDSTYVGDLSAVYAKSLTPTAVKAAAYPAVAGDFVPVDTTSDPVTITLPTAPADRSLVAIKHVIQGGQNAVTIAAAGSDVFDVTGGATSKTLPVLGQSLLLQYKATGAIWYVLGGSFGATSSYGDLLNVVSQGLASLPTASGTNAHAEGDHTTASGSYAHSEGSYSVASLKTQHAFASGKFSTAADGQGSRLLLMAATTDATPVAMTLGNDGTSFLTIRTGCTYAFTAEIVARNSAGTGSAHFTRQGLIYNNAGTTALVGSVTDIGTDNNTPSWDVAITADDTADALNITVTGEADVNVRWVARVDLVEVENFTA